MEQEMTIKEVLTVTATMLNNIAVPVGLKAITDQISNAVHNIQLCIASIKEEQDEKADSE